MEAEVNSEIKSFHDLRVYQNMYKAMVDVMTKVLPLLPKEEKFDLVDQMRRASKAAPALLAEGFAKRYQKKNWMRYLNDAMGECNEMVHHLSVCVDVYASHVDVTFCKSLINSYDICCRQLTNLGKAWKNYHEEE